MFMSVQRRATSAPPSLFFTDSTQKYVNTQTRHPCACWTLHNPGCSPPHFGSCLAAGIFHEAISSSSVSLFDLGVAQSLGSARSLADNFKSSSLVRGNTLAVRAQV